MNSDEQKQRLLVHLRRDISDERVIQAMERVPREEFIPQSSRHLAYDDIPLPIGEDQTISQPLMVALMIASVNLKATDKVLEIGTGSGYQAAVLSLLAEYVITTERLPTLANAAQELLISMRCNNVSVRLAGDILGCPDEAPYNVIIVAAGAPRLPRVMLDQLADGGRMVIPVGSLREQKLMLVEKIRESHSATSLGPCRFVPLLGPGAWDGDAEDQDI